MWYYTNADTGRRFRTTQSRAKTVKLSKPQQEVSSSTARFKVLSAGRRFGKSMLAINEIAKFARFPNARVLAVAPTYKQIKQVLFEELKAQLIPRKWIKKINESELIITLVNGSQIYLRSADNYDALRGGKYNFAVLDEVQDIKPVAWNEVIRPTLSDLQGHALFIGTPKGLGNFLFDLYSKGQTEESWESFQYTTLQGGNVPPEEIESARRDLDARTFEQEYEAAFVNYAGVIFYNYTEDNIVPFDWSTFDERTALHIGIDFNNSPITATVGVKNKTGIHIVDEIEIFGSNTNELAQEIRNRYGAFRQIYVYPDATGSRTNTNSNGVSDHVILQNAGFKVVTGKTNPNVNDSIASVNSLLCNGKGERNLLVDPKCKRIRETMLRYVYKEGTRIPNKDNVNDHFADNIRYLIHRLYPLQQLPLTNYAQHNRVRTL